MTQEKVPKEKIKVGFFGGEQGGKSQLVRALSGEEFSEDYVNTIGVAFKSVSASSKDCELFIAEMGDAERHDSLISTYAKQFADISVICIDQSNHDSLERAQTYINGVKKGNPDTQIIIAVTKIDLHPPAITPEEIRDFKHKNKIESAPVIETSAKNNVGIKELHEGIYLLSLDKDKDKIMAFSEKVQKTIAKISSLQTDSYNLHNSPAFAALITLKEEIDKANGSKKSVQNAIDQFTQTVNENTLKVEPPDVRWQITRFFQALLNWDKSYFEDNQAEIQERARFTKQTSLKDELTSFKDEAKEEQNKFSPN
ncbi:hypothetical protein [Legionella tucsonensis]|uniref:Ras family GTPase n=1 Tax=Legionella tucsonensis TaxID=40335 RepID=A0A0W0ZYB7_9GAMM|nr:hypothetical protein [Legionella tucsonensis]KTD74101.1 Ras family GTPase [Legionella tucsonensis]